MGDSRARHHAGVPQLGPSPAAADPLGGATRMGRVIMDAAVAQRTPAQRTLAEDVLDGLSRPFKELPPKHLYDARGSALFEAICELPEYYPTRTERAILEAHALDMLQAAGTPELLELGAGAATKTRLLLDTGMV